MPYLLLAIDDTDATRRMVDYVATMAPQLKECKVRMVAIMPNLPGDSQQLDALLGRCEEPQLHGDEDQYQELRETLGLLKEFTDQLLAAGVPEGDIQSRILPEKLGVAQDLYEDAIENGCDTLVVGRRHAALKHLFGSVSSKLVNKVLDHNVWVIS